MRADIQSRLGDLLHDLWKDNLQNLLRESADADQPESKIIEESGQKNKLNPADLKPSVEAGATSVANSARLLDDEAAEPQQPMSVQNASPTLDSALDKELADRKLADREEPTLVANAKADPQAFGILYERYIDRIYAYIYKRVGNAQDTEDLTANTFYKALNKLNSYEERGYPFSAWLFRIAHNLVANWYRDSGRRRFLPLDRLWWYTQEAETDTLVQKVEREEKHSTLWDAINRLPPERRELLIYKFNNCLSNVEIGKLMNKSESAIKSLYFRTLAALRQDLEAAEL